MFIYFRGARAGLARTGITCTRTHHGRPGSASGNTATVYARGPGTGRPHSPHVPERATTGPLDRNEVATRIRMSVRTVKMLGAVGLIEDNPQITGHFAAAAASASTVSGFSLALTGGQIVERGLQIRGG
jgi:hypothetical protein